MPTDTPPASVPSPPVRSLDDAREWLRKRFRPDLAGGVSVLYRLELSGADGGVLDLRIDDGRLELGEGLGEGPGEGPGERAAGPDVVMQLAAADFFAILMGRANPDLLQLEDRLVIRGDLSLALRMRTFFRAAG